MFGIRAHRLCARTLDLACARELTRGWWSCSYGGRWSGTTVEAVLAVSRRRQVRGGSLIFGARSRLSSLSPPRSPGHRRRDRPPSARDDRPHARVTLHRSRTLHAQPIASASIPKNTPQRRRRAASLSRPSRGGGGGDDERELGERAL